MLATWISIVFTCAKAIAITQMDSGDISPNNNAKVLAKLALHWMTESLDKSTLKTMHSIKNHPKGAH